MIIKAFITELPKEGDNIFKVRIPFLEDNTNTEVVFDALLCYQPGLYYGYKVGDCVFVIFENDKLNVPIIIGKLFINVEQENNTYQVVNNLNVTGNVSLPPTTSIGGYTISDFFKYAQRN